MQGSTAIQGSTGTQDVAIASSPPMKQSSKEPAKQYAGSPTKISGKSVFGTPIEIIKGKSTLLISS